MQQPFFLNINGHLMSLEKPLVMGILNATPDSFYSDSRAQSEDAVIKRVGEMLTEGASIIDVGACSTRPGGEWIDEKEELHRLHAVFSIINKVYPDAVLSVDTFRAGVAEACVTEHGVAIVNDVSAGTVDERMFDTVARLMVPYVLTHNNAFCQHHPLAYQDFLPEVFQCLAQKLDLLQQLGVNDVIIDPGFGFGKTLEQNYQLLGALQEFWMFESPVLVGVSRKSMIYNLLGTTPGDALNGTTVLNTISVLKGANILRVHDVKEAVETIKICKCLTK